MDLIVINRGGGSIEDLWAFNEKIVAEMIFKSSIPIVSAWYETDFTISILYLILEQPHQLLLN